MANEPAAGANGGLPNENGGFVLPCEIRFGADGSVEKVSCDLTFVKAALKAGVPLTEPCVPMAPEAAAAVAENAGFAVEGPFEPVKVEEWHIVPSNGDESG